MKTTNYFPLCLGMAAMFALCACSGGTHNQQTRVVDEYPEQAGNVVYSGRGVIRDIDLVRRDDPNNNIGLGTLAGAVVGGIVGHQIGGGTGKDIATVAGAAGGAYAGHQLEKQQRDQSELYRFSVRMDNGRHQRLLLDSNPGLRVGDRVRIDNGVVQRE